MQDAAALLLRSLHAATILAQRNELTAEEVNALAARLGLTEAGVLAIIERLKADGLVELHWGGRLSLTAAGREQAAGTPKAAPASINLASGAILAINSSGTIGHGAGATDTTVAVAGIAAGQRASLIAAATADLAALIQAVKALEPTENEPAARTAKELGEAAQATLDEIRKPDAESGRIKQAAGQLGTLLNRFADLAAWGNKVHTIAQFGQKVLDHLDKLPALL
jgi:DNA-binding MarR family transcriptional regulator